MKTKKLSHREATRARHRRACTSHIRETDLAIGRAEYTAKVRKRVVRLLACSAVACAFFVAWAVAQS